MNTAHMMNNYKLGDILRRKREVQKILPGEKYKLLTVRLYHKGIILRKEVSGSELGSAMSKVKGGDFILSGIDARNGAFGIVPDSLDGALITNDFWCLEPDENIIDKNYLLLLTSTEYFDYICKQSSDGTTQRIRLQKDKFFNTVIKLPSLLEQKLITKQLQSIKRSQGDITHELNNQQDLVKKLRQSFLQEAMQGKLTEQKKEDGNARDLLEKIKAEKAKSAKKEKPLPPIKEEEIPFEIPKNWVWCRLGDIAINHDGARIPISQVERAKRKKIYDYYGASGIIDKIDSFTHNGKFLLIAEDGANLVAKSTPIAFIAEGKFWVNNHAHVIGFHNDDTINFMEYCINAIDIKKFITGGFQPKLSQGNMNLIPIPFPPLSEQTRIVKKLAQLMHLCDELEAGIKQSQEQNQMLLQQVLREALAG